MGIYWDAWAVPGLLAGILSPLLGIVVYLARPTRLQNRLLAILLMVEGTAMASGSAYMYLMTRPEDVFAFQQLTMYLFVALPALYLLFLSTLRSPLARPLANWPARALLGLLALAAPLWPLLDRGSFTLAVFPGGRYLWNVSLGSGASIGVLAASAVALFGFAVALGALLSAPRGTTARAQAKWYVAAFAFRDVGMTVLFLWPFVLPPFPGVWSEALALVYVAFVLMLAYGVLRHQLFDIDLRIKWTLNRATVAAAFVAVFFAASEGAAAFFENRTGSAAFGIAAAALLVFALAPVQRLADRVADAAMPRVRDTEEYRTVRKRAVYRAAVESALADGEVTQKERAMLATLQDELGLYAADALAIERAASDVVKG